MTLSWRWLVGLGWAIPLLAATFAAIAPGTRLGRGLPLAGGLLLLVVAPTFLVSGILFAVAALAGWQTRRHGGRAFAPVDAALQRAAVAGIVVSIAVLATAAVLYFTPRSVAAASPRIGEQDPWTAASGAAGLAPSSRPPAARSAS